MPDIIERMLDTIHDYSERTGKTPTTIYLGWYEMHEFKNSDIFSYYNKKPKPKEARFHNCDVYEVYSDSHLNVT